MSSKFLRNTSKLLAGNSMGQLIGIIAIPIITRLYSVENYGLFSTLLAISIILATLSTFSMHLAILIPKSDLEARQILKLTFFMSAIFCIVTTIFSILFYYNIVNWFDFDEKNIIFIIPVLVLLQSLYIILTYWGVRNNRYGTVSTSKITEGLVDRLAAIGLGFVGYVSVYSLIFSRVLSNILAVIQLLPLLKKNPDENKDFNEANSYWYLIKRYKKYLQYNTPSMLVVSCILQLPVVIIAAHFSVEAAGLYAIANRVVNIPVSALGNAISQTFTKKIAEDYANNDFIKIKENTANFYSVLFSFLLIPFAVLTVIGEPLFTYALGERWVEAGELASILSFLAMSTLLTQAFGGIFDVFEQQKRRLIFHIFNILVRIGSLYLCIFLDFSLIHTLLIFSFCAVSMNVIALYVMLKCVGHANVIYNSFKSNVIYLFCFYCICFFMDFSLDLISSKIIIIITISIMWFFIVGGFRRFINLMG